MQSNRKNRSLLLSRTNHSPFFELGTRELVDISCRSLVSSRQISCRTPPFDKHVPHRVERLTLRVDGANFTLPYPFTYVHDPSVHRVHPLESFVSGGRSLLVYGVNFASLQKPMIGVFNGHGLVNDSVCTVINDTLLVCPSPNVADEAEASARNAIRDISGLSSSNPTLLQVSRYELTV